jgi:hypothetical protein
MPTITVKLDKKRAADLSRWARSRNLTKSEAIRDLIDRRAKIETVDDLIALIDASDGKGLGLKQRKS